MRNMKNLSYIGSSKKEQQRERTRTLRKSRRLALKRRRLQRKRRSSVADILNLTSTRRHGNNLVQEAAEELALTAALNDHQQTVVANKRNERKTKTSKGKSNRRESTLSDYPLPRDFLKSPNGSLRTIATVGVSNKARLQATWKNLIPRTESL